MYINEKAYYAYFTASDCGNDGTCSLWNPYSNYSVVKTLTTWEMYYNVAACEMYYDFGITAVDFNEFVLSFQYEVDKMKFLRLGLGLLKIICWSSKNATTTNGAWN